MPYDMYMMRKTNVSNKIMYLMKNFRGVYLIDSKFSFSASTSWNCLS